MTRGGFKTRLCLLSPLKNKGRRSASEGFETVRKGRRDGFSLMEVILAMSILIGGVVVLGRLAYIGSRHARKAEDLAKAQLLCEARMNEILTGLAPRETSEAEPVEGEFDWVVSSELETLQQPGVVAVRVTVKRAEDLPETLATASAARRKDVSFSLVRWIADPLTSSTGGFAGNLAP